MKLDDKKLDQDSLHKEIDLIQSCITRMANNSFSLKKLFISLVVIAMTLLFGQKFGIEVIGLYLFIITIVFWGLDAFFLKIETLYRWKYEWVIAERLKANKTYLYDLNPYNKHMWGDLNKKDECLFKFILSKTLVPFYSPSFLLAVVFLVYHIILLEAR